jgi:hypothetical protein
MDKGEVCGSLGISNKEQGMLNDEVELGVRIECLFLFRFLFWAYKGMINAQLGTRIKRPEIILT